MKPRIDYAPDGNARAFVGEEAVNVFAMAVLASALRMYANSDLRANRAYTPKRMMEAASRHLGRTFKARDYIGAADALSARVQDEKDRIARINEETALAQPVIDEIINEEKAEK